MKDFSKTYRGVAFFGLWAEETADDFGSRDAVNVLAEAVADCIEDDVRQRQAVLDALEFLSRQSGRALDAGRFRKALDEPDPLRRFTAAAAAVRVFQLRLGRKAD